jgi:hypothetical protein
MDEEVSMDGVSRHDDSFLDVYLGDTYGLATRSSLAMISAPPGGVFGANPLEHDTDALLRGLGVFTRQYPMVAAKRREERKRRILEMPDDDFNRVFSYETWTMWCNFDTKEFLLSMPPSRLTDEMILCACRRFGYTYLRHIQIKRMTPVLLEAIVHVNPNNLYVVPLELVTMELLLAAATRLTFTQDDPAYGRIYATRHMREHPLHKIVSKSHSPPGIFSILPCHVRMFGKRLIERLLDAFYPRNLQKILPGDPAHPEPLDVLARPVFSLFCDHPLTLLRNHDMCLAIVEQSRGHQRTTSMLQRRPMCAMRREWERLSSAGPGISTLVQARIQAHLFMLSAHQRCGAESPASMLVDDVLELICKMVVSCDDSI